MPVSESTSTTQEPKPAPVVIADADQEGFAAPLWDDTEYGEEPFLSTMVEIAGTGAEWVTLVPTWYQDAFDSSEVYAERPGRTATDESLVASIAHAKALGLKVMLKPHIDLVEGGARLDIVPTSPEGWFDSYGDVIVGYARLAEQNDVDQFVVGTELAGVSSESEPWRDLIRRVRQEFTGSLTYAANHDEFVQVEFWDVLDFVGVDAYFPLADQPTTDVDRLVAAWESIVPELAAEAGEFDRQIVFVEVGYPSQQGATVRPFDPFGSTMVSNEEQEAALIAMLSAVDGQPWFGGFHWWMWFADEDPGERALGYMPQGKPIEAILRSRWSE
jgi:hypothetical protein